ncbi:sulfotransferase domain-containing protein [Hyphobacterium sp. CCMP332]|nr:sulfotransferase domain-containing protein [Hyphobacterium sp. CCMP332]
MIPSKQKREKINNYFVQFGYHTKPSFLIVGAQKAGTSALFQYLSSHSEIIAPPIKEMGYFSNDSLYKLRGHYYYHTNFPKPHQINKNQITFEATPEYLYHPECAKRIFNYDPKIKIIILLREPVSRAYSAWTMYHNFHLSRNHFKLEDKRTFEEAIQNELMNIESVNWYRDPYGYLRRGIYYDQVNNYLKVFPKDQIMILESNYYKLNVELVHKEILNFIGIDNKQKLRASNMNERKYHLKINSDTGAILKNLFKPYNEKLFNLIGQEFDWNKN